MKFKLLSIFLFAIAQSLSAQNPNFLWAGSMGGNLYGSVESMHWDDSDFIYTIGNYNGTFDFDPDFLAYNLSATNAADIFIHKTSPDKELVWVKSIGSTGNDKGEDIITDDDGNIYVTGSYTGAINFTPPIPSGIIVSAGLSDIFIAKYNEEGTYIWSRSIGGIANDSGLSIGLDDDGNLYVAGYFNSILPIDNPDDDSVTSEGLEDIFVLKTDPLGEVLWVKSFGGESEERLNDMLVTREGEIYLTGSFKNIVDFDTSSGSNMFLASGFKDAYVLKLNTDGNTEFIYTIGDFVPSADDQGSEGVALAMDDVGDIYVTGYFSGGPDMMPGIGVQYVATNGDTDIFIQKINENSDLLWVKTIGGSESDKPTALTVDNDMAVYLSGDFRGNVDFNPNEGDYILSSLNNEPDAFVQKLSHEGTFIWATPLVSIFGHRINGIVSDHENHIYISGRFNGAIDMNPNPGGNYLNAIGSYDAYIAKYNNCISISNQVFTTATTLIANASGMSYQWFDCDADNTPIPGATDQIFYSATEGTYSVEITDGDCTSVSECYYIAGNIGIDEYEIALTITPNPSQGEVNFNLLKSYENLDVKVRNTLGQLVASYQFHNKAAFSINIDQPAGLYIVELTSNTGASSLSKIIKE